MGKKNNLQKDYAERCIRLFMTLAVVCILSLYSSMMVNAAAKPKLNKTKLTLTVGRSQSLKVKNKIAKSKYTWKSSKKSVATVSKKGKVVAKKAGDTTITCKVKAPSKTYTLKCKVKVKTPAVTGVSLSSTTLSLKVGQTTTIKETVKPEKAGNKKVTWASSNDKVVTVKNGAITAKSAGTANITVKTAQGGKTAVCKVKVSHIDVAGVKLNKESISLEVYDTFKLVPEVLPANAGNKKVAWKSSNESVARVYSDGTVEAVGQGEAVVTVTTENGGKTAFCKVVSTAVPVTGINIAGGNAEMGVGETQTLSAVITPANATNKNVEWTSSDHKVAVINQKGVVEAVDVGKVMLSAKTEDGEMTAGWMVKVTGELGIREVQVTSLRTVLVTFNQEVSSAVVNDNFKLTNQSGNTVKINSVSSNPDIPNQYILSTAGELAPNGSYSLEAVGILLNGETQDTMIREFTVPKVDDLYEVKISIDAGESNTLKADSGTVAEVAFEVIRKSDKKRATEISGLNVAFKAYFGSFAVNQSIIQQGVAKVLYNSKTLGKATNEKIIGTITNGNYGDLSNECNVLLDPAPNLTAGDDSVGAIVTDVIAEISDRVIIYFNKPINIKDFQIEGTKKPDPEKMKIIIGDNIGYAGSGVRDGKKQFSPKAIQSYEENEHAIVAILDVDVKNEAKKEYLHDNSRYAVQVTDKSKSLDVTSEVTAVFSDAEIPIFLGMEQDGLTKLVAEFSEPIINIEGHKFSAVNPENWVIGGYSISNESGIYPILGKKPKIDVGEYNEVTGEDARHTVTISCGTTHSGTTKYIPGGKYGVAVATPGIGDWAHMSDPSTITNTQGSIEVTVVDNETKPELRSFEVQSPEQYVIVFNSEDTLIKVEEVRQSIKLQQRDMFGVYQDIQTAFPYSGMGLRVTALRDNGSGYSNAYVIETTEDWTVTYDGTNQHYYNDDYRLYIPGGELTNYLNGQTNGEIGVPISAGNQDLDPNNTSAKMRELDTVSPEFIGGSFTEVEPGRVYTVKMTEPVKAGKELIDNPTPSKEQTTGVPSPTARFVKEGMEITIPADITCDDPLGQIFTIMPKSSLTKGNWQLIIASISDDVGNTSTTLTYDAQGIEGESPIQTSDFRVEWAVANEYLYGRTEEEANPSDYIFVKFTEPVSDKSILMNTAYYTWNSNTLPEVGSVIEAGIDIGGQKIGIDEVLEDGSMVEYISAVTIRLPDKTFKVSPAASSNIITISPAVKNYYGVSLSHSQYVLPYGEPPAITPVIIERGEWIAMLLEKMGCDPDVELDEKNYSFADIEGTPNAFAIEVANSYGILPEHSDDQDVPLFYPERAADREFAAATAVKALGYCEEGQELTCSDRMDVSYPAEVAIAVNQNIMYLISNTFQPKEILTAEMQEEIFAAIDLIVDSTVVDESYDSSVTYVEDVVTDMLEGFFDYTIVDNANGEYTIEIQGNSEISGLEEGKIFILPTNETYQTDSAYKINTIEKVSEGNYIIIAVLPEDISEVFSSIDYEGIGIADVGNFEAASDEITFTYEEPAESRLTLGGSTSLPGKFKFGIDHKIKGNDDIKLKGSVELSIPDITCKVDADFRWSGIDIKEFLFSMTEKLDFKGGVYMTAVDSSYEIEHDSGTMEKVSDVIELGRLPIRLGATGLSADLVLSLAYDVSGKLEIQYTVEVTEGYQYINGNGRFIFDFKQKLTLDNIEGEAKTGLQLGINLTALSRWDLMGMHFKIGPAFKAKLDAHLLSEPPMLCVSANCYLYSKIGLSEDTLVGKFLKNVCHYTLSKDLLKDNNDNPVRIAAHFENGGHVDECTFGRGSVSGCVYSAADFTELEHARIILYKGLIPAVTTYTDENGYYVINDIDQGKYTLKASATDYQTYTSNQIEIKKDTTTYAENMYMVLRNQTGMGSVFGEFINVLNGELIENVTYEVRQGWANTIGEVVKSGTADGYYEMNLEPGNYTISAEAEGYIKNYVNVAVTANASTEQNISLSTTDMSLGEGGMRMVLTWGETPSDLDSHLFGPNVDDVNQYFHTYYSNQDYDYNEELIANLDWDIVTGKGPETTSIYKMNSEGTYSYYVHDFTNRDLSDCMDMSKSRAKVQVIQEDRLIATFNVPTNMGGTVWHVFDYDSANNSIIPINTMSYSSDPGSLGVHRLLSGGLSEAEVLSILAGCEEKETKSE